MKAMIFDFGVTSQFIERLIHQPTAVRDK